MLPSNITQILAESKTFSEVIRKLGKVDTGGMRRHIKHKLAKQGLSWKHRVSSFSLQLEDLPRVQVVVDSSYSYSDAVRSLGGDAGNGTHHCRLKRYIRDHGVDCSHFVGRSWNKGKTKLRSQLEVDELANKYLVPNSSVQSSKIRRFVIEAGLLRNQCVKCGLTDLWNGSPICLHLDHIDGDHTNNSLSNLRILCPNCHSQTSTYCNKRRLAPELTGVSESVATNKPIVLRLRAGSTTIAYSGKRRKPCKRPTKIVWPTNEELASLVQQVPLSKLGPMLGVSDNAVKKRCLTRGIPIRDHRKPPAANPSDSISSFCWLASSNPSASPSFPLRCEEPSPVHQPSLPTIP